MSIHRQNYEAYFLDYLEDRLTARERAEVEAFLVLHPDLRAELEGLQEGMEQTLLPTAVFPFKDSLRKEETSILSRGEELLLKELDGALSEEERTEWETMKVADASWSVLSGYFPHTVIRPEDVSFEYKYLLKFDELALKQNDTETLLARALEGDLNTAERDLLFTQMAFDEAMQRSWKLMQHTRLSPTAEVMSETERLKIPAAPLAEWLAIAVAEGDTELPPSMSASQALRQEVEFYRTVRLTPPEEVFPHKKALYRRATPVISLLKYWAYSAAAAAVVSIAWFGLSTSTVSSSMAHHKELLPSVPLPREVHKGGAVESIGKSFEMMKTNEAFLSQEVAAKATTSPTDSLEVVPVHSPMVQEALPVAQAPGEVPVPSELPLLPDTPEQGAIATTGSSGAREYMTIWQFATDKAKSTLWGSGDYPKDAFATALVQKELRKRSAPENKATSNEVESIETNGKKKTRIKLGKLEFERTRRK